MLFRYSASAATLTVLLLSCTGLALAQDTDKVRSKPRPHPTAVLRIEAGAREQVRCFHSAVKLYPKSKTKSEWAARPRKHRLLLAEIPPLLVDSPPVPKTVVLMQPKYVGAFCDSNEITSDMVRDSIKDLFDTEVDHYVHIVSLQRAEVVRHLLEQHTPAKAPHALVSVDLGDMSLDRSKHALDLAALGAPARLRHEYLGDVFSLHRLWRPIQDVARRVVQDQAGQLGGRVRAMAYSLTESTSPSGKLLRGFLSAVHNAPAWESTARAINESLAPPLLDVAQVVVKQLGKQHGPIDLAIETPHYFRKPLTAALKTAAPQATTRLELLALDQFTPEPALHLAAAQLAYDRLQSLWP